MSDINIADAEVMLTTSDNPYNPFTQWDDWLAFDEQQGYYTPSYLARVAKVSNELSDIDYDRALLQAINDILFFNITGNYIKVTKGNFKNRIT